MQWDILSVNKVECCSRSRWLTFYSPGSAQITHSVFGGAFCITNNDYDVYTIRRGEDTPSTVCVCVWWFSRSQLLCVRWPSQTLCGTNRKPFIRCQVPLNASPILSLFCDDDLRDYGMWVWDSYIRDNRSPALIWDTNASPLDCVREEPYLWGHIKELKCFSVRGTARTMFYTSVTSFLNVSRLLSLWRGFPFNTQLLTMVP